MLFFVMFDIKKRYLFTKNAVQRPCNRTCGLDFGGKIGLWKGNHKWFLRKFLPIRRKILVVFRQSSTDFSSTIETAACLVTDCCVEFYFLNNSFVSNVWIWNRYLHFLDQLKMLILNMLKLPQYDNFENINFGNKIVIYMVNPFLYLSNKEITF